MGRDRPQRSIVGRPRSLALALLLAGPLVLASPAQSTHLTGPSATYTNDPDFDEGASINVVHKISGQLQLDDAAKAFTFVWVAVSSKGTAVKIDTRTGAVLGEYRTAPSGMQTDPSRTTVDKNGNVWVANRAEGGWIPSARGLLRYGSSGSVVHIGLEENGQCQDRNNNGAIDTSRGIGDVRTWLNTSGADTYGGVSTAQDECVIRYVRVNSTGTRHVSVTANNDVWVSGIGEKDFDLISGATGQIVRAELSVGCGGYGGLIDGNGVIWSARNLLRWDTSRLLVNGADLNGVPNYLCWDGRAGVNGRPYIDSYGLGIDRGGNVWNSELGSRIRKFAPNGTEVGIFPHGGGNAQGVVVDRNDHVWVAHSLWGSTVGHLRNNGTWVGNVKVGSGPTGVAVDADGKIWATNYYSRDATRIDPAGAGGIGLADLQTRDLGGNLYNYSDMTGSVLLGAPPAGSWTVVHDGGTPGRSWETISWNADVFGDGWLAVAAATSEDGAAFGTPQVVTNGAPLSIPDGRYLRVVVTFRRATSGESPILYDLTIGRHSTRLAADPAIASVRGSAGNDLYFPNLTATLTEAAASNAIVGRLVTFSATDLLTGATETICTATTDSSGRATCSGLLEEVAAIRGLGYRAVFEGDLVYAGSSATAPIVSVDVSVP